jgi:hypothetical protein
MVDTLQRIFQFWADTLQKWTLCNDFFDFGRTLCKNGLFATIYIVLGGHFATTDALQQRILCNSSQHACHSELSSATNTYPYNLFLMCTDNIITSEGSYVETFD